MPIVVSAAVAIMLTSPGPALFRQTRVGRNERCFTCYKFRTMHQNTGDRPSHEVSDSAITPVGRFLRRWKIDELPQLLNVIRGDMSLIGPRPCLTSQRELIEARRHFDVFRVRPGISGLAQVNGVDMSKPRLLARIDGLYVHRRGGLLDLQLVIATVLGGGVGIDRVGSSGRAALASRGPRPG